MVSQTDGHHRDPEDADPGASSHVNDPNDHTIKPTPVVAVMSPWSWP